MSLVEQYKKKKKEIREKYLEPLEEKINEYGKLIEKYEREGGKELEEQLDKLKQEIENLFNKLEQESCVEYQGKFGKARLKINKAEFLAKYEDRLSGVELGEGKILKIELGEGQEDIYESGDLALLDEVDRADVSETNIKSLTYDKLPKKVKEIIAWKCEELTEIDLSGYDEVDEIDVSYTKIKKIDASKLPRKVQKLVVDDTQDINDILKNKKRFKGIEIVIIKDRLEKHIKL